jgi:formamidopyrimidine-DNA glycosylase
MVTVVGVTTFVFQIEHRKSTMPELPEAQTIATYLARSLLHKKVQAVHLRRKDFLKTGTPAKLHRLAGRELTQVSRHGKYVIMHFSPLRLVIQLGMSGRVSVSPPGDPLAPHTHVIIDFGGDSHMRYANSRRIASGIHVLDGNEPGPLAMLGPDALAISPEEFVERVSAHRTAIKATLLNQSVLAGVGNIYSDEALFVSGISPRRKANRVGREKLLALHKAVRQVLLEAVKLGGSTLRGSNPFAGADGSLGEFTMQHQCYGRYGQPCVRCGRKLRRATIGGRTSTFCPHCQK